MVDGGGSLSTALIGDIIAGIGSKNNWSGVVIHGAIRDTVEIGKIDFGVKALGSNPRKSEKKGAGLLDVPLSLGGFTIAPGDWVYCDADGVVAAKRELPVEFEQSN